MARSKVALGNRMNFWWKVSRTGSPSVTAPSDEIGIDANLTAHPVLDAIRRFVANEKNEALVIYGPWGVGKTYAWKKILDEALRTGGVTKRRYAYTSLFGIAGLDAFRASVFENTNWLVDPNAEDENINEWKRLGNFTLDKFKKHKYALPAVPYIGKVVQDAGPFYFTTVRDQIICIDDVERRGASLSVQDVLGLVSFLKEQRDCKVIVLLNDGELGGAKEEYERSAEKVFDEALMFNPSPSEAANIAIGGDEELDRLVKQSVVFLGINNIRVISKIYRFVKEAEPFLSGRKSQTIESARKSSILFGWIEFQPNLAPKRAFVFDKYFRSYLGLEKKNLSEEEEGWRQLLSTYGFVGLEDVDRVLVSSLDKGIIEEDALKAALAKADDDLERSGRNSPLSLAWDFFREGFGNNENAVVERLIAGVRDTKLLSVGNLSATYNLLSKLGREQEAQAMVDEFVKSKQMPDSYWNLSEHFFEDYRVPVYIQKAFDGKDRAVNTPPDMKSILRSLGTGDGYNPEEIDFLAGKSVADFIAIIESSKGEDLRRLVNGGLRFRRLSAEKESAEKRLTAKMLDALKSMAQRSRIDRLRAKSLAGIALDDDLPDT